MAPPYTPLIETVPPRRTVLIESSRALSRSTANCSATFSPSAAEEDPTGTGVAIANRAGPRWYQLDHVQPAQHDCG
jgi:hypothetical protein